MLTKMASEGWELVSAEDRNVAYPKTFLIPAREKREALTAGDGAKLLFEFETGENGRIMERMWVIVQARIESGYIGVLDNDPVSAKNLSLRAGASITFGPEHIASISVPPRAYVIER
jgi:uncharacterized protein YegJ (DUF2314 family)